MEDISNCCKLLHIIFMMIFNIRDVASWLNCYNSFSALLPQYVYSVWYTVYNDKGDLKIVHRSTHWLYISILL